MAGEIDLRPWGYAPGGYTFKCIDCPADTDPMSQFAAKRAWRCEKHALEARYYAQQGTTQIAIPPPAAGASETAVDGERLVTITIGIGRNGDIFEDTQCHGNGFADVYRGMVAVQARVNELVEQRRSCPFNPGKPKS